MSSMKDLTEGWNIRRVNKTFEINKMPNGFSKSIF